MTTATQSLREAGPRPDHLSGTPRAHAIDRWIYVFMAAFFVASVLGGFVPSSVGKMAAVEAGQRPPFPLVMHLHALLMGSFMLLLLAQTVLVAVGKKGAHRKLGMTSLFIAPALVVVGFILARTVYQAGWQAAQAAPPEVAAGILQGLAGAENILLLQLRVGIVFPVLLVIGLMARNANPGLHKRMMILSIVPALPAAFDRMAWLPSSLPAGPLTTDLYPLLAIMPMLLWDVIRNRSVHAAYWIFAAVSLPVAVAIHLAWDTPWWHQTAKALLGAG